jgi:hypothetical protein
MLPNKPGKLSVTLNMNESYQESSHQNAALHGGPSTLAISIDAQASFPGNIKTQEDVKAFFEEKLSELASQGWNFHIHVGLDSDHEEDH